MVGWREARATALSYINLITWPNDGHFLIAASVSVIADRMHIFRDIFRAVVVGRMAPRGCLNATFTQGVLEIHIKRG